MDSGLDGLPCADVQPLRDAPPIPQFPSGDSPEVFPDRVDRRPLRGSARILLAQLQVVWKNLSQRRAVTLRQEVSRALRLEYSGHLVL
jgi:hypothetical protein